VSAFSFTWARMSQAQRDAAVNAWVDACSDEGVTWAVPCPACGSLVTNPYRHAERVHASKIDWEKAPARFRL